MHEGGGIHSAVQPLSTLFTIFFFFGPVAQPVGSYLPDQWPEQALGSDSWSPNPWTARAPSLTFWSFKMNCQCEFLTYMDVFQALQMADTKSFM